MELAINAAEVAHKCDYIFTHDDDLLFHVKMPIAPSLPDVLLKVLDNYKPAIAAFPFKMQDNTVPAMKALKKKFAEHPVAPLTGYDPVKSFYYNTP